MVMDGRLCGRAGAQIRISSLRNATDLRSLCTATILSPNLALTAAHCVHFSPDQYILQLNNWCVNETEDFPKARVTEIFIHERYDRQSRAHDIALIRIIADQNHILSFIATMLPESVFGLSGSCTVYGYGIKDLNSKETSEELLEGTVEIVSLDYCMEELGHIAPAHDSGMMCAMGDGVDTCEGDSGGPIVCAGVLCGVSSYGRSCGALLVPAVYTSLQAHRDWIRHLVESVQ